MSINKLKSIFIASVLLGSGFNISPIVAKAENDIGLNYCDGTSESYVQTYTEQWQKTPNQGYILVEEEYSNFEEQEPIASLTNNVIEYSTTYTKTYKIQDIDSDKLSFFEFYYFLLDEEDVDKYGEYAEEEGDLTPFTKYNKETGVVVDYQERDDPNLKKRLQIVAKNRMTGNISFGESYNLSPSTQVIRRTSPIIDINNYSYGRGTIKFLGNFEFTSEEYENKYTVKMSIGDYIWSSDSNYQTYIPNTVATFNKTMSFIIRYDFFDKETNELVATYKKEKYSYTTGDRYYPKEEFGDSIDDYKIVFEDLDSYLLGEDYIVKYKEISGRYDDEEEIELGKVTEFVPTEDGLYQFNFYTPDGSRLLLSGEVDVAEFLDSANTLWMEHGIGEEKVQGYVNNFSFTTHIAYTTDDFYTKNLYGYVNDETEPIPLGWGSSARLKMELGQKIKVVLINQYGDEAELFTFEVDEYIMKDVVEEPIVSFSPADEKGYVMMSVKSSPYVGEDFYHPHTYIYEEEIYDEELGEWVWVTYDEPKLTEQTIESINGAVKVPSGKIYRMASQNGYTPDDYYEGVGWHNGYDWSQYVYYVYAPTIEPIDCTEKYGTLTVNYVTEDGTVLETEEVTDVLANKEYVHNAKQISGYEVVGATSKSVFFTKDSLEKTIEFVYKEEVTKGIVNVTYVNKLGEVLESKQVTDVAFGTEHIETAKDIDGYELIGERTKSVTLSKTNQVETITFVYDTEYTEGNVTVVYTDIDGEVLDLKTVENVKFGEEHTEIAKEIEGYEVLGRSTKSVTLSKTNPNATITFIYDVKVTEGKVKVNYVDTKGKILDTTTVDNVKFDVEHIETAKEIEGYVLLDSATKSVTLSKTNQEETIIFIYDVDYTEGNVSVIYTDIDGEVLDVKTVTNVAFDIEHTETAKAIDGYKVIGQATKSVTLTKENPNATITFVYDEEVTKGQVKVNYVDTLGNTLDTKLVEDVEFGIQHTETAKSIDGYVLLDVDTKSVTLSETNREETITFIYDVAYTEGTVTVVSVDTKGNVLGTEVVKDVEFDTAHVEYAKAIDGYTIVGDSTKSVTLTTYAPNQTIIFVYEADITVGTVTTNYIDTKGNILDTKSNSNVPFGVEYTETAKTIEGYELTDVETKSVTLSKTNSVEVITFVYEVAVTEGKVVVNYVNAEGEVIDSKIVNNVKFGQEHTEVALAIEGYKVVGETTKTVTLTKENQIETITFVYTIDTPTVEPPIVEPPVVEPPVVEPPIDEPIVDEPIVDEPTTDEPTTDEPIVDEPTTDEPTTDEPKTDEPKEDEPTIGKPNLDEPKLDEPILDNPNMDSDEPNISEPTNVEEEKEPTLPKMFTDSNSMAYTLGMAIMLLALYSGLRSRRKENN